MPIARDALLSHPAHTLWADLGSETAILDTAAGLYYGVDAVGARVWDLLRQPCTLVSIVTAISAEYGVPVSQCEADVREFLDALAADGLLRIATP